MPVTKSLHQCCRALTTEPFRDRSLCAELSGGVRT